MSVLADLLSTVFERRLRVGAGTSDDPRDFKALAEALLGNHGEVSGMAAARQFVDRFAARDAAGKLAVFDHMTTGMDIDPAAVRVALAAYEADPSKASYRAFIEAAEPKRQELIRRLNQAPGATERLVAMRADLLGALKARPDLAPLDLDFRHLFASWFNRGFLVLKPINWDSSARILDKIIAYEAVHAIDSWDDLRRRLKPADRRCFAFFHPAMPSEPLIFVEVALTKGVPGSIQGVLAEDRDMIAAPDADTAVFYSISNCQAGLAGISLGNSLIKQVVEDLSRELPALKTFVTLSPIPGLTKWLQETGRADAIADPEALTRLAAHYLLEEKQGNGAPRDPVARFHLGNGALVHAVHAGADTSANGLAQSGGAMVNYRYDLKRISQNHEAFAAEGKVAASPEVRALARAHSKSDA
jgi:malonyl-CoA decarboxylase